MDSSDAVYVAGHRGMVGSAVVACLRAKGFGNLILRGSDELDLTRQSEVEKFFLDARPKYVFLAAARVGGILANNTYRAEFSYTNLQIETNVIHTAWKTGVKKLLFFSSSCVYPRICPQPMKEEYLLTGPLEPTNEPYAMAKLAGMSMCRAYNEQYGASFISVLPSNLYGPNDNFDPQQSHLVAALILKFHEAKARGDTRVTLWGTGTPRRELTFVDDAAEAAVFLMENYGGKEPVNVGVGTDQSILEISGLVKDVIGFGGDVVFDPNRPDGSPQKLLDIGRLAALGWRAKVSLWEGVARAYEWYRRHHGVRQSR